MLTCPICTGTCSAGQQTRHFATFVCLQPSLVLTGNCQQLHGASGVAHIDSRFLKTRYLGVHKSMCVTKQLLALCRCPQTQMHASQGSPHTLDTAKESK